MCCVSKINTCISPNCGRSFSVVSNLRRHFKVHQKAAVGDKLSAEDRLRCVRNLMERSSRILANKKQILPYSDATSHVRPAHRKTPYPTLPIPQQQHQYHQYHQYHQQHQYPQYDQYPQYHHTLPDSHMNNDNFMLHDPHQNMLLPSERSTAISNSRVPIYWVNQIGAPTPCTSYTNTGAHSYGSNNRN